MKEKVQIVMDKKLLRAADCPARRIQTNRSALVRQALREHLMRLDVEERERRDREGYARFPDRPGEFSIWQTVVAWRE